ncbi:MAG TPA: S8 family serine peptidase [Natronosporangium sp.]
MRTAGGLSFVAAALVGVAVTAYPPPARADEVRDGQWHLEQLAVTEAHRSSVGEGVTVAVLDTGVDGSHPDLRGNVQPGVDLTGRGSDGRDDPAGTGTALAGLIAGHGHGAAGGDGVLGLAPRAGILPVVVAAPGAAADAATVAAGIAAAVQRGADVICLGRPVPDDPAVTRAAGAAVAAGAVVVIPAEPAGDLLARYGGLGVLGATPTGPAEPTPTAGPAEPSPAGVLAVPGEQVLSTGGQGGYFVHARTSDAAAAALLAGAAALVKAAHPQLAAHAVTDRLVATATGGALDLPAAIATRVDPPTAAPPVPPPTGEPAPGSPEPTPAPGRPTAPEQPETATEHVAAFDSGDWRRWLVAAPLVGFLIVLATASVTGVRRARRARR